MIFYMNWKEIFYYAAYILSILLVLTTPLKNYQSKLWFCKVLLVLLISTSILMSIITKNKLNDTRIFGALLFLNILILIPLLLESVNYSFGTMTLAHFVSLTLILLLLFSFSPKNFELSNGELINANKKWIWSYVFAVSIWCMVIKYKNITPNFSLISILLVSLPLLFPMEDYYIYRVAFLTLAIGLKYKYFH